MVDILLAVYNSEKYIRQQIDSIFEQSYKNWHLIIYDDASTDKTADIIRDYVLKSKGKISFFRAKNNLGSAKFSFSRLLKLSNSSYISFCDHDDVWHKDKLLVSINAMKDMEIKYPDVPILIHTDLVVVDENLKVKKNSMIKSQCLGYRAKSLRSLIVQNNITGCTVIINKKLLEFCKVIPKEALMHDWWFGLLAAAFGKIEFLKVKTVYYRQHGLNSVGAKDVRSFGYMVKRFLDGAEIKKSIEDSYIQCKTFLNMYYDFLDERDRNILEKYLAIRSGSKLFRILKLIFGRYFKCGFMRKIGQVIYI